MDENTKKLPLKQYAKNAYKYRYLMQEIVRKNVKLQYRNSFLGIFWTMLQPFLTMLVLDKGFRKSERRYCLLSRLSSYGTSFV